MSELQLDVNDFSEMLIKYMARHPDVYRKCRQLKVTGDDFVLDEVFGNQIYKEFVDTINNINGTPILQDTLLRHIGTKIDSGKIEPDQVDSIIELFGFIYGTPVTEADFFTTRLPTFLYQQRAKKVMRKFQDDPLVLTGELNKIKFELDTSTAAEKVQIVHPFRDLIFHVRTKLIGTNICKLDDKIEGLKLGEYAMLLGFTGGGKSTVGANVICATAQAGDNATYISCEDTIDNMVGRFYSKAFKIPYTTFRKGEANIELEAKHGELDDYQKQRLANCMSLISVKGVSEITPDFLYSQLVQEYETTGFVPVTVMLDQMQFISPNTAVRKSAAGWEVEKQVSAELDELSHKKIGGRNFVLWVQHQAKGKLKRRFTRDDIDGFKGVIQPVDLAVGVGRDPNNSRELDLFSIKTRHTQEFGITLRANFQFMDVCSDIGDTVAADYRQSTGNPQNGPVSSAGMPELPVCPMSQAQ